MMIPYLGQVGAGVVVPFRTGTGEKMRVVLPQGCAVDKEAVFYRASGDSLKLDRIEDGDILICTKQFKLADVTPDRIAIICLYNNEILVKRVCINEDGSLTIIRRHGSRQAEQTVEADQYQIEALMLFSLIDHR